MYLSKEKKEVGVLSNTKYCHSGFYNCVVLSGIGMMPLNARMYRRIPVSSIPLIVFSFVLACCLVVAICKCHIGGFLSLMILFST
jgi:hypothetical protein